MRILVHLSDLHFGRVDPATLAPLRAAVVAVAPDVIVVSGDLSQRARAEEFQAARTFLDTLPAAPRIVVPGNHDVPLYNIFRRFAYPLDRYRRYVTDDLEPFYADTEVAVLGLNTARSLTFKDGRINKEQIERVRARLCPLADDLIKIVVTHHPFDLPAGHDERDLVGRAAHAVEALARCGADVLLAGHLHLSHIGHTAARYRTPGHSALVVQAGTATSTRGRGEANSFNVIRVEHPRVSVERHEYRPAPADFFAPASADHFQHTPDGWARVPSATAEE